MRPKTYANVWDALEASPVAAENMKLRSRLMIEIAEAVAAGGFLRPRPPSGLA